MVDRKVVVYKYKAIQRKLEQMLQQNVTRIDFAQRFQEIIDKYNAGGSSTENYFDDLMNFTKDIRLLDHIIFHHKGYYSFLEMGELNG